MKTTNVILISLALVLSFTAFGSAAEKAEEAPDQVLFKNVHVWDGTSDERTDKINVLVEDNLIKKVGAAESDAHKSALVVEGEGKTLMPGLIEMHVHYSTFLPLAESRDGLHPYAHGALAILRAKEFLMNGYTTTRDAGGASKYLKDILDSGVAPGPRIYPSENWITTTSGHGDFRELNEAHPAINGSDRFYDNYVSIIADGEDETTRAVRETFRRGATQIKLFTSGGVTSQFDPLHSGPNPEEIRAAVKVATMWDTYVLTHSFSEKAIKLAIENGVRCIEHAPFITDEIAQMMIEKDVYLATSVGPVFEVSEEMAETFYNPASFKKWKRVRDAAKNAMEVFKRNPKLKIMLGSDLLGHWRDMKAVDDQMNLDFKHFGEYLGALKTLKMATSTAAEANLMTGKMNPYTEGALGVVADGAYADLLLVDGNPLEDILLLTDPDKNLKVIMKDGVIYKNSLLYEMFTPKMHKKIKKTVPFMYGDYNSLPD